VHIYVFGPKPLQRISFKSLSYLYEVGAQKFQPIFGLYTIFDCNFAKIVMPPSGKNKKSIALLNGQSLQKNGENRTKIDP